MRGIPSLITDIRKSVFTEVARMAYAGGDYTHAEDLPYIIVPGDQPLHRESIFLERAIAGAGTVLPVDQAAKVVAKYREEASMESPLESPYRDRGESLD